MRSVPRIAIVVPCYNEEKVLPETCRRLIELTDELINDGEIATDTTVYFVDDGSRDQTWALISQFAVENRRIAGIKLSRNQGHQNALIAGLLSATGDAIISIDADLQDDIVAMKEMIRRFHSGADIVYGVRRQRDSDARFKRSTAQIFYRIMRALGVESVHNHADYRLMSRRAVDSLRQYREVNLYLRGIVPLLGFRSETVYYNRAPRFAGESKYPLNRMIALAVEAITSFSVVPLRLIAFLGFMVFLGAMGVSVWALCVRFLSQEAVPGWTSTVLPVYSLGGIQIFCIGVLGEYLGKVYAEVKLRPRYFIEATAPPTSGYEAESKREIAFYET